MKFPTIKELREMDAGHFARLEDESRKPYYEAVKSVCDFVLALASLIIFAPFWLIIVILIHLDSKGRAVFKHTRIGRDGKPFTLYKFRTMYQGVKDQELAPRNPRDERVTRVGRFLRRTSLDEVPQLINILKGEMSLVGPRPEMPFIVEHYRPIERKRLLVKPGLTGIWQIMGRKDLPLHHNLEFDFYYIRNRSLLLDFVIILKTVAVVISGKGAY